MEYKVVAGNISASDPGNGCVKFNTSMQSDATQIYFDQLAVGNVDMTSVFDAMAPGSVLNLQQKDDANVLASYTVRAVTDNTSWYTIDVEPGASSGLPIAGNKGVIVTVVSASSILTATIPAGDVLSNSVDLTGRVVTMLISPPEWSPANISFLVSVDDVEFADLYDRNGVEVLRPMGPSRAILTPPELTKSLSVHFKLRSGPAENPVPQEAERRFTLVTT